MRALGFMLGVGVGAALLGMAVDTPATVVARQRLAGLWQHPSSEPAVPFEPPAATTQPDAKTPVRNTGMGESPPPSGQEEVPDVSAATGTADVSDPSRPPELEPLPVKHQALWSPFRNQRTAEGFARGLEQLSDSVLLVQKTPDGLYRVVLSYHTESERRTIISRIETRTGLELEDAPP